MPIGTGFANSLGGLVKAATGVFQSLVRKEKEEAENEAHSYQTQVADPSHLEQGTPDQIALSSQLAAQAQREALANLPEKHLQSQPPQTNLLSHSTQSGVVAQPKSQTAPPSDEANLEPEYHNQVEDFLNFGGSAAPGLRNLLKTWMYSDPKTLAGLEHFLQVEFSHYSADPEAFLILQLVTMLKQARQLLEEQKLLKDSEVEVSKSATEEAELAVFGASLAGVASALTRRKKLQNRTYIGLEAAYAEDDSSSGMLECLQGVIKHLEEAQKGLEKAMARGLDRQRLQNLIRKILEVCAAIVQVQDELSPQEQHIPA